MPPEGVVLVSGLTNPAAAPRERDEPEGECSVREVDDVVEGTTRWFRMTLSRCRGSTGGRGRGNGMSRCVPGGGRCPRRIASSISSCSAAVIRNGG